jgi:hypothetical protein
MKKPSFSDIINSKSKDIDMSFRRSFEQVNVKDSTPNNPRHLLWFIAIASVILLFFVLSYFFSGATIHVSPKSATVPLDDIVFTATKATTDDNLGFEVMAIKGQETKTAQATVEQTASQKASGQVIVYNDFSTSSQKLITGTRFETADGKIFKIGSAITIPGQKIVNGKVTPGSVEATVTAAEAGDSYNIALSDFTIPGFKGSPKYQKIYARSKTVMSGGSLGAVHILPEADANKIREELTITLKTKLLTQAKAQVPEGYMFFDGTVFMTTENASGPVSGKDVNVSVVESGTLRAFIFKRDTLTKEIAKNGIREYDNLPVSISNFDALTLSLKDHDLINPNDVKSISFSFSGTAQTVWDVDQKVLIADLISIKKKEFDTVLKKYPSIEKATLSVKPFWKLHLPDDTSKIKIVINQP